MNDYDTVFPLPLWFLLAAMLLFACTACASTEETKVCFMKPFGMTDQGYTVAAVQCMSPEAFEESQK